MSELTREYLDKKLDKLATKEDIRDVKVFVKTEINSLETKLETKIETEVGRLETKIETEIAGLARMTNNGLEDIKKELDVKKQVENHNRRIYQIERALNIKN